MKIPDTVRIGSIDFKIIFTDIVRRTGDNDFGYMDPKSEVIVIDQSLSKQGRDSTFFHEVIEAINSINDLNMTHQQVSALEHGIHQVLRQM